MKTSLNLKSLYRSILACSFGLALGLVDHLANAQDTTDPKAEAVEDYAPIPAIGSPDSDLNFQTYRLSYMQSDRVIALLKALGYATVEFSYSEGESLNERVFSVVQELEGYPLVIKLIDANKTSLMEPALEEGNPAEVGGLGGTYLHQQTTGAPEQRLFIVYEKAFPEQLHALLQLLRNEIDVPARQVVIEALVVEVDTDKLDKIGFNYSLNRNDFSLSAQDNQQVELPFIGKFDDLGMVDEEGYTLRKGFSASLEALTKTVHAEILSNPSVLVLNGRQARIQVGQQVPSSKSVATVSHVRSGVEYLQTGIVLNLRPRISEDGSEVTMQIETIVSSVNPANSKHETDSTVLLAPLVDNREVQTFVRVADNTPFIVGGLIATDSSNNKSGLPLLSKIPYVGNLFKRSSKKNDKREVIVVLTPHVIDTSEKSFSYVIPKDSKTFDSFDHILFRNAYRIRDDDLFDLSFATQSGYYKRILKDLKIFHDAHLELSEKKPIFEYLHDRVPGEEVIVRRMIWEIVHKAKYHHHISADRILVFEANDGVSYGNQFKTHLLSNLLSQLNGSKANSLVLDYADHRVKNTGPFEHPRALISKVNVTSADNFVEQITVLNSDDLDRNTVLISNTTAPPGVRGATSLEVLKGVLVLKRILALNHSMPVSINEFRVGRQIIFPTEQELQDKYHIIDYEAARFFYQIINYYPEFENAFNRDSQAIVDRIQEHSDANAQ